MKHVKIVLVGDRCTKKAAFAHCWQTKSAIVKDDYCPAGADNYSCTVFVGGQQIEVQMWDTSGQEDYKKLRPLSYVCTDIFLLFFLDDSVDSLDNIRSVWAPEVLEYAKPSTVLILVSIASEDCILREAMGQSPFGDASHEMVQQVMADIGADHCLPCCVDSVDHVQMVVEKALEIFLARKDGKYKKIQAKKKPKRRWWQKKDKEGK